MKRDELKTLRDRTGAELAEKAREINARIYELRQQTRLGQLKNYAQTRTLRRDLARVMTFIREKQDSSGGKK